MGNVTDNSPVLQFNFTGTQGYSGVDAVEVVMFSCPEWGTAVAGIVLLASETVVQLLLLKSLTIISVTL
jgi:hypothetical protein